MSQLRRKCYLANPEHADTDLRQFEELIVETVNKTIPGKNPKVYKQYFSTDILTQSEAVSLGRALAKIDNLCSLGKTVTILRLFTGKVCAEEDIKVITKKEYQKPRGGRMK